MIRLRLPTPPRVTAKGFTIEGDGFIPQDLGQQMLQGTLPRTFYNYARDVQQGFGSNVVMAPVMWIMRTFTEARAVVESRNANGIWKPVEDHPLQLLIDKPNDSYDGDAIWKATCISYPMDGNGYWQKVRNRFGDVIALWYRPHWLMHPKYPQDGSQFISHYELSLGGPPLRIETRDVIHFRFGLDPQNPRLGLSPLRCLLREIFTDDEAANFSAKMLENMGVAGMVVSPKDVSSGKPSDKDTEALKTAFTGDSRGKTLVLTRPTEVKQYGLDPSQMTLGDIRDIAEERVCAALGLPAAVVGFGSGMQSTKVGATMRELRRLAWVQCLTPMQQSLARQLTAQLLPDFVSQTRRFRVRFDTSDVGVFEEEDAAFATKVTQMVTAGVLRVDRAQEMLGLEVDETQQVYLRPSNAMPIDDQGNPIKPATPPGAVQADPNAPPVPAAVQQRLTQATGNGNGKPQ